MKVLKACCSRVAFAVKCLQQNHLHCSEYNDIHTKLIIRTVLHYLLSDLTVGAVALYLRSSDLGTRLAKVIVLRCLARHFFRVPVCLGLEMVLANKILASKL